MDAGAQATHGSSTGPTSAATEARRSLDDITRSISIKLREQLTRDTSLRDTSGGCTEPLPWVPPLHQDDESRGFAGRQGNSANGAGAAVVVSEVAYGVLTMTPDHLSTVLEKVGEMASSSLEGCAEGCLDVASLMDADAVAITRLEPRSM